MYCDAVTIYAVDDCKDDDWSDISHLGHSTRLANVSRALLLAEEGWQQ